MGKRLIFPQNDRGDCGWNTGSLTALRKAGQFVKMSGEIIVIFLFPLSLNQSRKGCGSRFQQKGPRSFQQKKQSIDKLWQQTFENAFYPNKNSLFVVEFLKLQ